MIEKDIYEEIEPWFNQYLKDKYPKHSIVTTTESSTTPLDIVLRRYDIDMPELNNLLIKVDILGILRRESKVLLGFIEVKTEPLNLKDLGQLWGYTELANPIESYLISLKGLGTLEIVFNVAHRVDILRYGDDDEKTIKIAKWDRVRKMIDYSTLIPKE